MAATNEQIAAMEAALYSGELRTRFNDREVTWRSVDELTKALAIARASQMASTRIIRLYNGSDV
jgi:hypothetical protein